MKSIYITKQKQFLEEFLQENESKDFSAAEIMSYIEKKGIKITVYENCRNPPRGDMKINSICGQNDN